ncbi:MAG: ROK family transcriptional regulator [Fusobacterium varium]|jgi:DNA-binding Lrp family transcriptional regulator/cell division protein FtsL|uniref:ROK family transcriptional regulator n=1 Tax=Fusobacterium TaxID=848 RepID=UPI000E925A71|nr:MULTISPECIES: ROK family transcriptional regulator [Fusobacterium]UYI78694.1 MAG: ROK family transcriptional regulator [Fusobacterium varium]HBJ78662.1 ROK family transcriptional regulator [Fusobacterium sp.]
MATINGKPKIIKEINMALVRKNIIRHSPITKPELSKLLGLSLPTVNKCVDELLEKEIVKVFEGEIQVKGSGKKPIFYEINSDHVSYIAAYFKGTILTVREYNLLGKIKNEKVKKLKEDSDEKVLISVLDKIIKESKNKENIEAISIGVAGIVEENGSINNVYTLKKFNGVFLKRILEKRYNIPIIIENDANLVTFGLIDKIEFNTKNLVYIYMGTGIGTGTVIDGKLHKGKSNFSGEIGELPISIEKTLEDDYKEVLKRKDMEKFEKIIIFVIMINISILNPEIIVLNSDILKIEKSLLRNIIKKISKKFGEKNMPEIILDNNDIENGMKGALKLALQESDKDLKIIGK